MYKLFISSPKLRRQGGKYNTAVKRYIEPLIFTTTAIDGAILGLDQLGVLEDLLSVEWRIFCGVILVLGFIGEAWYRFYLASKHRDPATKGTINSVLTFASESLSAMSGGQPIRASIMWPSGFILKRLKVRYHSDNMANCKDLGLSLEKWQGCAGLSWGLNQKVAANLTLPHPNGTPPWGLDAEQVRMTEGIISVSSVPIRVPKNPNKVSCILNLDSTGLVQDFFLDSCQMTDNINSYAELVTNILHEQDII